MLLSLDELQQSTVMHPEIAQFLASNSPPQIDHADYKSIRQAFAISDEMKTAALGPPGPDLEVSLLNISMRDGFSSQLKIHKPTSPPQSGSPLIVLCFGGGWIVGNNRQLDSIARQLVQKLGAVVVSISYRLAPEHKFPIPTQDGIDSVRWIAENASQLTADPSKGFIVGGVSAGATMSTLIARHAQLQPFAHPITGQWLCVPSIFNEALVPEKYTHLYISREQNKDAPILDSVALKTMAECGDWDTDLKFRYPTASGHSLAGLPPAYIQADGMDGLRDDALIYDELLKEVGVDTKVDFYPGCPHAHFAFFPGLAISVEAERDIMEGMVWLLERQG